MNQRVCFVIIALISTLIARPIALRAFEGDYGERLPPVLVNDNRRPAGTLENGSLVLKLRAAVGLWRPEGDKGTPIPIESFGEDGGSLQIPAPLIRVPEGTEISADIRNDLDVMLRVHGLCARDGSPCPAVEVPPASLRHVRFAAGRAGTYHYWATTTEMPLPFRGATDTQLSGAFIVDPSDDPPGSDRVLVITEWTSLTRAQLRDLARTDDPGAAFLALNPLVTFLINGLSWPATEHLNYRLGEQVRWRVVNPQLAVPSNASSRLLLRCRGARRWPSRRYLRPNGPTTRRHATASAGRDDGDDVAC